MSYRYLPGKLMGDKTATAAEIIAQLLLMGWELYDDVSASSYKVLRSNGESGLLPWIYVKIYWGGTNVAIDLCAAWNSTSHSTTAPALLIHNTLAASRILWMHGSKDFVVLVQESAGAMVAHCFWSHVTKLPPESINTTTTAAISASSNVAIPVASSSGFLVGAKYQIFDPVTGYRQTFTCIAVSAGLITADAINTVGYGSGSRVGTHPFSALGSYTAITNVYSLNHFKQTYNGAVTGQLVCETAETSIDTMYRALSMPYIGSVIKRGFYPPVIIEMSSSPYQYRYLGAIDDDQGNFYICPPISAATYGDSFTGAAFDAVYMGRNDSGTTTGGNTVSTLNDTAKSWSSNQWAGKVLVCTSGTEAGQIRKIVSNTSNQLVVSPDFTVIPVSGAYVISDKAYRYYLQTHGYLLREGV